MNSSRSQDAECFGGRVRDFLKHLRIVTGYNVVQAANACRSLKSRPLLAITLAGYLALFHLCVFIEVFAPEFASRNVALVPEDGIFTGNKDSKWTAPTAGQCVARGLMEGRYDDPSIARVKEAFDCGCRVPDVYERHETPTFSAIIQSFNHRANIPKIALALVDNPLIQEIIVCEDGSTDDSLQTWHSHLRGLKHFIVISNNLHETRCYNRAMRMTSADFFLLMQDDDIPPFVSNAASDSSDSSEDSGSSQDIGSGEFHSSNWVEDAFQLFQNDPSLGVLSGFIGQIWNEEGRGFEFGEQESDHGGLRKGNTQRIPFLSKRIRRPFMYVECAWIAPLFVRAHVLRRVGGLDIDLFRQGQPGVWQDCVLSYAAWSAGWRVGVYDSKFTHGVGGHGSTSDAKKSKLRDVVWRRAKQTVDARYERDFTRGVVLRLNNESLNWRYSNML